MKKLLCLLGIHNWDLTFPDFDAKCLREAEGPETYRIIFDLLTPDGEQCERCGRKRKLKNESKYRAVSRVQQEDEEDTSPQDIY